jgi:hypothetical protein
MDLVADVHVASSLCAKMSAAFTERRDVAHRSDALLPAGVSIELQDENHGCIKLRCAKRGGSTTICRFFVA